MEDGFKPEVVVLGLGVWVCENWGSGREGRRDQDFWGGPREGHAWEFREMENCSAWEGALRSAKRKGCRIEIGERVGSCG